MQRHRRLTGPPLRTASAAWGVLTTLIKDTLVASKNIDAVAVTVALAPLRGLGPALIAAGHLETTPITLISNILHVNITVATGAGVVGVEENLNPVPGGATATQDWTVYLPSPAPLAAVIAEVASQSEHLSVDPVPAVSSSTSAPPASAGLVNLAALDNLQKSS